MAAKRKQGNIEQREEGVEASSRLGRKTYHAAALQRLRDRRYSDCCFRRKNWLVEVSVGMEM